MRNRPIFGLPAGDPDRRPGADDHPTDCNCSFCRPYRDETDPTVRHQGAETVAHTPLPVGPSRRLFIKCEPLPFVEQEIPQGVEIPPDRWANINTGETWVYIATCRSCNGYGCFECNRKGYKRNSTRCVIPIRRKDHDR